MDRIPDIVLQRIIASIINTHTGLAIPLLLTNKKIAHTVLNVLYEGEMMWWRTLRRTLIVTRRDVLGRR
jgi:hypothetical protein